MKFVWPKLHGPQLAIARHPARFKVVDAGRRFGKSKLDALLCTRAAMRDGPAWWITPTYKMALMAWRELMTFATRIPGAEINLTNRLVDFSNAARNGSYVQIRSAVDPTSLRGEGLAFAALDEFAFMDPKVWTHSIRPALADRRGRAIFTSTPFGQNYFFKLFQEGLAWGQTETEFMSWSFPSTANPFLNKRELARLKRVEADPSLSATLFEMPEDAFRQEHLAEFLPDGAGVFRGVDAILDDELSFREKGRGGFHVIGWDPAKFVDFNVVTILDVTRGEIVYMARTNRRPLMEQLREVKRLQGLFPGKVVMDATRDDTLIELAGANGLYVEGVKFTEEIKRRMVNSLGMAIENRRFRMPRRGTEIAVGELKSFRYELGKTGHVSYSAPAGMHDDHVTALGLCVLGMGSRLVYTGKASLPATLPTSEAEEYANL